MTFHNNYYFIIKQVTGDNVHSLALCDFNLDGKDELLIGSEDYDIRIFHGDEMIGEISEADAVVSLCSLGMNKFGFALANGIVGVYAGEQRQWRSKVSKRIYYMRHKK